MPVLSSKIGTGFEATDPTDSYLHIILSDGFGGYESFVISLANFQSLLQADIDAVTAIAGEKAEYLSQSANFNFSYDPGTVVLFFIIQQISGTVDVEIGSSAGTGDIVPRTSFASGIETFTVNKTFSGALTIYVTRHSGTFNLWAKVIEGFI